MHFYILRIKKNQFNYNFLGKLLYKVLKSKINFQN